MAKKEYRLIQLLKDVRYIDKDKKMFNLESISWQRLSAIKVELNYWTEEGETLSYVNPAVHFTLNQVGRF